MYSRIELAMCASQIAHADHFASITNWACYALPVCALRVRCQNAMTIDIYGTRRRDFRPKRVLPNVGCTWSVWSRDGDHTTLGTRCTDTRVSRRFVLLQFMETHHMTRFIFIWATLPVSSLEAFELDSQHGLPCVMRRSFVVVELSLRSHNNILFTFSP